MKRGFAILLLLLTYSFADTALILHKGWQLIGATSKITDMSLFEKQNVEQLWHYDAVTQSWKGYSPDPAVAKKISDKGYGTIDTLQSWHGFWIKSKKEWVLTLPTENGSSDENITLRKGWNLISLPVDTVVSPHIFDGKTVWKYSNKEWKYFDTDTEETFPLISHITNSDGIWVKSDKKETISTVTDSAKLHNFASDKEMESYIRDMLLTYRRPICGYYPLTAVSMATPDMATGASSSGSASADGTAAKNGTPSFSGAEAQNSSQTNLQETGVDEADILKHNDQAIFFLYRNSTTSRPKIGVTTFTDILNGQTSPSTSITPRGVATEMYLSGEKLVVLSPYDFNYAIPENPTPEQITQLKREAEVPSFFVEIFDIGDLNDIRKLHELRIDGYISTSRVVDGALYLVSQFRPTANLDYPHIYVDAQECKEYFNGNVPVPVTEPDVTQDEGSEGGSGGGETTPPPKNDRTIVAEDYKKYARCYGLMVDDQNRFYRNDYDHPKIISENLIPKFAIDQTTEKPLIKPETLFASDKKDQEPLITTVSKIDIAGGALTQSSSVLGYSDTVYASTDALYLVSSRYPIFESFDSYALRSALYKFTLGDRLGYQASGFVRGKPLNRFSLSDYNATLRIAVTEGNSWQNNTRNTLYTLKTFQDALVIQGVLSGLGKAGETIHGVRFLGNRGYVVTFKRTDPFYTIDLSDPAHPKKAGELQIDGFSSYLHPISKNLILGFGRDATPDGQVAGLKLELFDVSDFAHPLSLDSYTLPGNYTQSEIEYNPKALAYRDSDKRFAFPYRMNDGYRYGMGNYLGLFRIAGDTIKTYRPPMEGKKENYISYQRGLLFDMNGQTYVAFFSNGVITYRALQDFTEE